MVIGRSELIAFAGHEKLTTIPAKTDTGAYRSSVHANNIYIDDSGNLHFTLFAGHPACNNCATEIVTDKFSKISISNSFGVSEERYEVTLKVKIGPKVFKETFTLANRAKMAYPVLLGRKLLNGRFLVNPAVTGITRDELKTKFSIHLPDDEESIYNQNS